MKSVRSSCDLLLERVLVTVVDGSEQVRLECHWRSGNRTAHTLLRPVARVTDLHRLGNGYASIAAILNQEVWRPPSGATPSTPDRVPASDRGRHYQAELSSAPDATDATARRMDDPRTGRRTRPAPVDPLQLGSEGSHTEPLGQNRCRLGADHSRCCQDCQTEDDPGHAAALAPLAACC